MRVCACVCVHVRVCLHVCLCSSVIAQHKHPSTTYRELVAARDGSDGALVSVIDISVIIVRGLQQRSAAGQLVREAAGHQMRIGSSVLPVCTPPQGTTGCAHWAAASGSPAP